MTDLLLNLPAALTRAPWPGPEPAALPLRLLAEAAAEAAAALAAVASPDKRVFWPFLLSALAIAWATRASQAPAGQRHPGAVLRWLFSPRVWWHPSSRMDLRLMLLRGALRALLVAPWMVSALALAKAVVLALDAAFGAGRVTALPGWAVTTAYTLTAFVAWDFSRYLLHRLAHEVPLLWRFHQVHHSAEVMTPWTLYRSHPVEGLLFTLRGVLTTGVVAGGFFHLFGPAAMQADFWGVNALFVVANLVGANLRHSHVWLSYGARLERWLISPAQHQLHHSDRPEHFDRNYGAWLAIWDRIGGSLLTTTSTPQRLRFGLPADQLNHDPRSAWSALAGPLGWRRPRRPAAPREA
jgi:sterol desaturase/sphingolipid hydroxylase (fatty acid hydroxylase superfamily)